MTVLWSADSAAAATGGRTAGDWRASGVSIDTRTLLPGDLFVALKDRRDGHDYTANALAKGAAAAMVNRVPEGVTPGAPLLIVDDVSRGLEALGRAGRTRFGGRVAGVTGSAGKTSTKEMLRTVLKRQGQVHAAEASHNNHWGVPLTLARMPPDADFALIEIGMNRPGEIAPLAKMARPHVAMITTIASAHMEAFCSIEEIAHEKAAILQGVEPKGIAILNGDVGTARIPREVALERGLDVRMFGEGESLAYRLSGIHLADDSASISVCAALPDGEVFYRIASAGRHFAVNALGVLAAVEALGADVALAAHDMSSWRPTAGRGTREKVVLDPADRKTAVELIDDAFNANPASMAAALEVLAASQPAHGHGCIEKGRRVAILGDMLELGPDASRDHASVAGLPHVSEIDILHCSGPRMRALWEALPERKRGRWTLNADDLAADARNLIDAGDVVLVKGSKGSCISRVVDAIRELGHPALRNE